MKYLVLIYSNPESRALWDRLSRDERSAGLDAYAALDEELAASGELIVSEALADPSHTTRVTVRDGQTLTTDGPFAEAKELLAGFFLLDCETPERAVEIAARVPEAHLGLVEVRPVLSSLDDFPL
ncbi:YciI family protein [Saccharothrix hoggarensis]|uniref:YciI family protein n=1 Tax=Saccharothrix hoggarensis TaxID=913853 RepID=A0ABW3R1F9_9PSEU